jgi:putative zinc finger protein
VYFFDPRAHCLFERRLEGRRAANEKMNLAPNHPPFERLADLAEGRLAPEEARGVKAHLAACRNCAAQLAEVERVTNLMRADNSVDAPRDVLSNAVRLFDSRQAREGVVAGAIRRIVASLSFDSLATGLAYGVRSGGADASRQLIFTAGDVDVDLRLAPSPEGWAVSGQILGECAGGWAELSGAGAEEAARTELNTLCEFALPVVPAGSYTLRLGLGDTLVEVPGLDLN